MKTNQESVEELISQSLKELEIARQENYDSIKAEKTAALFLVVQIKLAELLQDVELNAKQAKNEIDRIEAEKYLQFKETSGEKKITENGLTALIAKDKDVISIKNEAARAEAELKKFNYILNTLKDAHIYMRAVSKRDG
jgi:hypothetical protein